jgi:prepilin-type N-terminal cleavage/methylation domain-containing protein
MSQNRGFTLIEALITATIVALGLVAVASIFSFAVRANISNRQMAVATALAYDKMEVRSGRHPLAAAAIR